MQQHCVSYGLWSRCVVQLRQHNICRRMLAGPGFCWRVAGGGGAQHQVPGLVWRDVLVVL